MCVSARRRRSFTLTTGSGAKMSSSQMIGSLPAINTTSTAPIKTYVTANPVPVAAVSANVVPQFIRSFNHSSSTASSSSRSSGSGSCCKRRQVAHSYHDHSQDMPSMVPHITRGGVKTPFPMRLHNMLNGTEAEGLTHIVSWQPHGRSFLVHKVKEFVEDVMPKYFNQGKFASFQRQLNLYGFKRLTRGPDTGSYYNELFLRGRPFLAHDILRTKIKGNGARAASNPDAEPNFYTMPSLDSEEIQQQAIAQPPVLPTMATSSTAVASVMSTLAMNFQQAAAAQRVLQQPLQQPKQVVSAEDPEWDSTADYLLDVLDSVVESNMDIPTSSPAVPRHPGAAAAQSCCSPSVDELVEIAQQPHQQPSKTPMTDVGTHAPLPLVSDDEDEAACAAAFYSDDTLDDILAGVDLGSDYELGMILEKMVSE